MEASLSNIARHFRHIDVTFVSQPTYALLSFGLHSRKDSNILMSYSASISDQQPLKCELDKPLPFANHPQSVTLSKTNTEEDILCWGQSGRRAAIELRDVHGRVKEGPDEAAKLKMPSPAGLWKSEVRGQRSATSKEKSC